MLPVPVLPSNAPPLHDDDSVHHASRIPQEHSGYRQHDGFSFGAEYEQKFAPSLYGENSYAAPQHIHRQHQLPRYHRPTQHQQHYHHPQYRHPWRHATQFTGFTQPSPEQEAKIMVEADYLYRRFKQSEAYVKYRTRQTKEDKPGGEEQKWPDHLEKAFFRALVTWPPMGRGKILHKDKQRGRNELIADCILELTGEHRTRKQVSSHIQVLKPFVEGDAYIMRYLSKEDLRGNRDGSHSHAAAYGGGRRASTYPAAGFPHAIRTNIPVVTRPSYTSLSKQGDAVFEPIEFEMFVQQKFRYVGGEEHTPPRRLHTYTQYVPSKLEADGLHIDGWQIINRDFPLLSRMHSEGKLNCNVIIAKAHLAFPPHSFKAPDGSSLPGVELGISFLCSSTRLPATPKDQPCQVKCHNIFYENGKPYEEPQIHDVYFERSDRDRSHGMVDTQIKFGSTYWAKTLGQLANKLLNNNRDTREEVATHIRSINAVQEIFVADGNGFERLLVIHWTFRQSSESTGRTSWRRLILPPSPAGQSQTAHTHLDDLLNHAEQLKAERQDSVFDPYAQFVDLSASQPTPQQPLPALQSPFEYESSSGSALSSATWPTSLSDSGLPHSAGGQMDFTNDNTFDFTAGNINLSYDHHIDFNNFDSSAFDFGPADFAADPALEDYSHNWTDATATASFDTQASAAVDDSTFMAGPTDFDSQPTAYDGQSHGEQYSQHSYKPEHQQQHSFSPQQEFQHQNDRQAFEGAGQASRHQQQHEHQEHQEGTGKEQALATLADASYVVGVEADEQQQNETSTMFQL